MSISTKKLLSSIALAGIAVGAVITACACPSKTSVRGGAGILEFEIVHRTFGPAVQCTGNLPAGKCVEIEFLDASGKSLGKGTTAIPGTVDIPPGATGANTEIVDCPKDEKQQSLDGGYDPAGFLGHLPRPLEWREVSYFPFEPVMDGFGAWTNTMLHARVRVPIGADPMDLLAPIIELGPGVPVGPNVQIVNYLKMSAGPGGATMVVADNEPITGFNLDWNGTPSYATLGSSQVVGSVGPNNWHLLEVRIPESDFDPSLYAWNGGQLTVQTASDPQAAEASFEVQSLEF